MRTMHQKIASILMILGIMLFSSYTDMAFACSPIRGFKAKSNIEQVNTASSILVGRVANWEYRWNDSDKTLSESFLQINPVLHLKGEGPIEPFKIDGIALTDKVFEGMARPSRQDEFELPHISAISGGCNRGHFVVGQLVLFLLDKQDDAWGPIPVPFSRWAEDVSSLDAPWVRLVRIYITANAMPKKRRKSYLESEKQKLLSNQSDRIAGLMAQDIDRQITGKPGNASYPDDDFPSGEYRATSPN